MNLPSCAKPLILTRTFLFFFNTARLFRLFYEMICVHVNAQYNYTFFNCAIKCNRSYYQNNSLSVTTISTDQPICVFMAV